MKSKAWYVICCMTVLISACTVISVSENYDTGYDFSKLKTYDWVPVENKKHQLVVKQLRNELRNQLAVKLSRRERN